MDKTGPDKKTKKRRNVLALTILALVGISFVAAGLFIRSYWSPGKYALKEEDFDNFTPYIIVQEAHYTGTGWVLVGDESGYFSSEDYLDIDFVNRDVLPLMRMYDDDHVNRFLCRVEYLGKKKHVAFEDEIDYYNIVEWYPVYPVLRDTILPSWMFPNKYMTVYEVERGSY